MDVQDRGGRGPCEHGRSDAVPVRIGCSVSGYSGGLARPCCRCVLGYVFVPAFTFRWGLLGVRYLPVPEPKSPMSLLFATGGHSAYDTAKFRAMEGFDILYSPFYWEDIDLCTRAQARGWRVLLEPASRVSHTPGSSVARRHSQRRIAFWRADHRFLFTLRHSPSVGISTLFMFVASHGWSALQSLFRLVGRVQQIKRDSKESASVLKHHSLNLA